MQNKRVCSLWLISDNTAQPSVPKPLSRYIKLTCYSVYSVSCIASSILNHTFIESLLEDEENMPYSYCGFMSFFESSTLKGELEWVLDVHRVNSMRLV